MCMRRDDEMETERVKKTRHSEETWTCDAASPSIGPPHPNILLPTSYTLHPSPYILQPAVQQLTDTK
jgi:hypothetical protein